METGIDFLPERLRSQRARRRSLLRQANLLVLAAATFAAWMWFSDRRVTQARGELSLLRDREENVQGMLGKQEELQREQAELAIKDRISTRLGSRVGALDVLGEVQRLLPAGVALTSLNLEDVQVNLPVEMVRDKSAAPPAGAAQGSAVTRLQLVLTGVAPTDVDVATFIGQVAASPLFEDVNMGYIHGRVIQGHKAREFQVSCHVVK